jgi:hypothetical protein
MEEPKPKEKYLHFKGKEYEVIVIARDCEHPQNKKVVYKQLYDSPGNPIGTVWIRSLDDFLGEKEFQEGTEINGRTYQAGERVKRFNLME